MREAPLVWTKGMTLFFTVQKVLPPAAPAFFGAGCLVGAMMQFLEMPAYRFRDRRWLLVRNRLHRATVLDSLSDDPGLTLDFGLGSGKSS